MTRGELRAYFKEILNRSDCTDEQADRFIGLGVRKLERTLRVPTLERSHTYISDGTGSFAIPANYLAIIGLFHKDRRLERVSGSDAFRFPSDSCPSVFWREGPYLKVRGYPPSGDEVVLRYYGEFEEFGNDNYETVEMAVYPDAMVYAALLFAADFYMDERKPFFETEFNRILLEIQASAEADEFKGGDLRLGNPYAGVDY